MEKRVAPKAQSQQGALRTASGLSIMGLFFAGGGFFLTGRLSNCPGGRSATDFLIGTAVSMIPACLFGASLAASRSGRAVVAPILSSVGTLASLALVVESAILALSVGFSCSHANAPIASFLVAACIFLIAVVAGSTASFRLVRRRAAA
jgi:hypothetical protein